ncbi:hypothetical protein GCM10011494_31350 [Novosphingobium endophyticum]|uniref:Uncharacterized protein n=1 Tax=Novosphingobium endophyticum TaxID=1955250 RepID=A0A916TUC2_9SPHN|nr:hypothetical protein [Novosphingobium endophyticum]GGC10393.1 hypothetical protein GCM10011494_31350 [Novosphingobium endophyticum]
MSGRTYGFIRQAKEAQRRKEEAKIVGTFCEFVQNPPSGIFHDEKCLPYPKLAILGAFVNSIANSESRAEIKASSIVVLALAHYQEGVGESFTMPHITEADLNDAAAINSKFDASQFDPKKLVVLTEKARDDAHFIADCCRFAAEKNPHVLPFHKKFWLRFRQQGIHSPFHDGYIEVSSTPPLAAGLS